MHKRTGRHLACGKLWNITISLPLTLDKRGKIQPFVKVIWNNEADLLTTPRAASCSDVGGWSEWVLLGACARQPVWIFTESHWSVCGCRVSKGRVCNWGQLDVTQGRPPHTITSTNFGQNITCQPHKITCFLSQTDCCYCHATELLVVDEISVDLILPPQRGTRAHCRKLTSAVLYLAMVCHTVFDYTDDFPAERFHHSGVVTVP